MWATKTDRHEWKIFFHGEKYAKKIVFSMICVTGVYSREIINMFLVGPVSGLVKNFNSGIYSDTINVVNVNLCMMVLLIELYLSYHFSRSQLC